MRRAAWIALGALGISACISLDGLSGGGTDAGAPAAADGGNVSDASTSDVAAPDAGSAMPDAATCGVPGPTGSLLAYYPFDETSGTFADCSGHGLTGTFVHESADGGSREKGQIGGAIHVASASTTGCVDIGMPASLQTEPLTIAVWLKIDSFPDTPTTTSTGYVVGQTKNAGYGGWRLASAGVATGGGALAWENGLADAGGATTQQTWPNDMGWHHFAITVTPDTLTTYIDGLLAGSPAAAVPIAFSQVAFRIGCRADDGNYFDGDIDELRIYSRVLTPPEIQTLAAR